MKTKNMAVILMAGALFVTAGTSAYSAEAFGPVIETTLKSPEKSVAELLDLDTAQRATHEQFGKNDRETHAWIRQHKLDVLGAVEKGHIGVLCMDMLAAPAPDNSFDKLTVQEVLANKHLTEGEPNKITALLPVESKTDTYFFRTGEGGTGVLQIMGKSENPLGVKIRYKLVK